MKDYYSSLIKPFQSKNVLIDDKIFAFIDKLKKIKEFILLFTLVLIMLLSYADFYVLHNIFGFPVAFYKDFYLNSISVVSMEFLVFVALIPFVLAILFLAIPVAVVELYGLKKNQLDRIDTSFGITLIVSFLLITPIAISMMEIIAILPLFELGKWLLGHTFVLFIIFYLLIFIVLIAVFYFALNVGPMVRNIFEKRSILSLALLLILISTAFTYYWLIVPKQLILSFLLLVEPCCIVIFLEYKKNNKKRRVKSGHVDKFAYVILFAISFIFTYESFTTSIEKNWKDLKNSESINDISLNLLLNTVFLSDNKKRVDINLTGFDRSDDCLKDYGKMMTLDYNSTKVILLSDSSRLYFKPMDEKLTCVYAVNKTQYKGKEKYSLFDVGKLVKE